MHLGNVPPNSSIEAKWTLTIEIRPYEHGLSEPLVSVSLRYSVQYRRGGDHHEWHVDLANSFDHIEFGFASRFVEEVIPSESAFSLAGFKAIGSIGDSVAGNALK